MSPANGRRLSKVRIAAVVLVVITAVAGGAMFVRVKESEANAASVTSSFAPYVDVTAMPQYPFEGATGTAATSAVLGFVVSTPDAVCEPSWGAAYSLAAAADGLNLGRRVARLRQLGGEVTISFGGVANAELSIGCTDQAELTAAYGSVVDRYSATIIDLDIEGAVASDPAVSKRRAEAIAALATEHAASGKPLAVWLTLPVSAAGLTGEGQSVLAAMLAAKVDVAGVNGMTMDYGVPLPAGSTMADQGELALTSLQQQIRTAFGAAGTTLSDDEAWYRVGATPMIGQNDTPGEVFGLDDAHQLVAFAQLHHMHLVSMWSANRDQGCGPNYPNVTVVSDACSGVSQSSGEFAAILGEVASGHAPASTSTQSTTSEQSATTTGMADDPATSPYPIWNINQAYPKDSEIVWHRSVYQAKWYTTGDQPDRPVATAELTPWLLIGPVLPGESPAPTPTLAAGTYPDWSDSVPYAAGSRVLLAGVGYQAKYWTQGDVPGAPPTRPGDISPWEPLATG